MSTTLTQSIRTDFQAFVAKAFRHFEGTRLVMRPYISYLCSRLAALPSGGHVVNMPPRHLKTFIGSVCLAAWTLGNDPASKILVLAGSEHLAEEISRKVREIVRSSWFRSAFPAMQLSKSKSRKMDFATDAGGELYAASIFGNFTGRGGHLIIVDDPVDIRDASNLDKVAEVNSIFDNVVISRLNNVETGRVLVIMHRLHDHDLSGHLFSQGGWRSTVLPLIARRTNTYDLGYEKWTREKGELLRPDAYSRKAVRKLRKHSRDPDFELLYQQNSRGTSLRRLKRRHFGTFTEKPDTPIVISVDTSFVSERDDHSFNVVQAWSRHDDQFFLVDQWREQCRYPHLRRRCLKMAAKYRPAAILVERASNGSALVGDLREKSRWHIVEIVPLESKVERFRQVGSIFRSGKVNLPNHASWLEQFFDEVTRFPNGPTDDQMDAATQALKWLSANPVLCHPPARAIFASPNRGTIAAPNPVGVVIAHRRSVTGAYPDRGAPNSPFIQPKVWVRW